MNYLKYIEYSAENLQFYLWYRDYASRWEQLKDGDRALAPEWKTNAEVDLPLSPPRPNRLAPQIAQVLKDTDFTKTSKPAVERVDPFNTPQTISLDERQENGSDYASSVSDEKTLLSSGNGNNHRVVTDQAFGEAGLKWKPCMLYSRKDTKSARRARSDKL